MAFNLGTIESKVKVDGLAQFGDDLKKADATMDAFAQQTAKRFTRVETDVKAAAKAMGMSAQEMQGTLDRAMKSISADTATKSLERMSRQLGLSKKEVEDWGRQLGLSAQTIETLTGKLSGAGSGMSALVSLSKPLAGAIAGAFSIGAITSFVTEIANTKMQFEAFDRTLKMVTGSQTGAALAMESLAATSDRLGLRLVDAADGYKLIGAAAKGTTLEGTAAKSTFEAVASAASVLGLSASDTNGILLALSQMISKGKVQAEELRGQLGERLPGAFQIAARAMGMTTAELDKTLQSGGLMTDQFLPKFAAELQKTFGQGATEAGNSTQAAFNRMQNAWDQLKAAIGDTSVFGIAIAAMEKTAAVANAMAQSIRSASGTLQGAAKVANLQARLDLLQSPEAVNAYGLPENYDPEKAKAEIEKVTKELATARQDIEDAAQEQLGKARQNAINKQYEREQAAIKGGETATLDAWASSSDKKVSLWATQQKEVAAAYEKAYKGEITQGAMDTLVGEANKKYASGLEDLAKKGEKAANAIAKADAQATKLINEARGKAEEAAATFNGDTWAAKEAKATAEYQKELDSLQVKLVGYKGTNRDVMEAALKYWAEYEYGARMAKIALDKWRDDMKFWGDTMSQIGELSFDPAKTYDGELTKLKEAQAEALRLVGDNQEKIDAINQLYALKETGLREKTLGDVAKLDDDYWQRRMQGVQNLQAFLEKQGVSEKNIAIAVSREKSKIAKEELEARIGYESSFLETLKDVLADEFGLYKDSLTRQHDEWVSLSKDLASSVHEFSGTVASAATDAFKSWITGSGTMQDVFKSALDSMLDYLMNIVQRMIKYALENYVVIPIVEELVGSDATSGIFGKSSGSGSSSSGLLDKAVSGVKSASGITDLFSSGASAAGALGSAGVYDAASYGLGSTALLGETSSLTGAAAAGSVWEAGSAASLAATPSVAAAVPTAATEAAAATGASAGAAAGASIGIGTVLGVAGGIAGLVGLGVGLFSSSHTETKTGSGLQISVMGNSANVGTADYYRVTDSSMLGGSSTSHEIRSTGAADAETASAVNSALGAYTNIITSGFDKLGVETKDSLDNFYFPQWDVASGQEEDFYRNVSNAKVGKILSDSGLTGAFKAIAEDGEYWIDQITRLQSAMSTVGASADAMGLSLEKLAGENYISGMVDKMLAAGDSASTAGIDFEALAGVMDDETLQALKDMEAQAGATGDEVQATNEQLRKLAIAQYASELVDAFGSTEAAQAAFSRLLTNAYSSTEQAAKSMTYYAENAGQAIGALGDASVTIQNFWSSYRAAMESGSLTADQVKSWDDAAQWVEAWDSSLKSAGTAWEDVNKTVVDGLNDQIDALGSQADAIQDTLDLWSDFLGKVKDLRQSIKWNKDLTDLSPKQLLDAKKLAFDTTSAKAKTGDQKAMADLDSVTNEYLEAAKDYYASSEDYFSNFDHADETLSSLESYAQVQVDSAQLQLDALNNQIAVMQLQVNQLTLVNTNLGTLASAWGDGVNAIVGAINNSGFSSSYADAIAAANAAQASAAASLFTTLSGGSSSAEAASDAGVTFSLGGDLYSGGSGVTLNEDGTWQIAGFAGGGNPASGSLAWVGENGPEIVRFGAPGQVYPVEDTAAMLRRAVSGNSTDTSGIERRLDAQRRASDERMRGLEEAMRKQAVATGKVARKLDRFARQAAQ